MYSVEMYVRVCRACMVEGMSVREASRQRGHRGTRRCALQGWRRGDGPALPAAQLRRPNPAPAGHQRILCPRGQVRRAVLPALGRRRGGSPRELWIYDLRTNQHFTLKANSLERPPHHPKQHGEKPRLPEPNFIKPRGFQDDCFFRIFNSFKPTHEPSMWPTLPRQITGVPLSRTRRRWRNLPLRRRTCPAIPAARRSCLLRRPAHPW